jgi:hypothetical protein
MFTSHKNSKFKNNLKHKLKIKKNMQNSPSKDWKQVGEIVGNSGSTLKDSKIIGTVLMHGSHTPLPLVTRANDALASLEARDIVD